MMDSKKIMKVASKDTGVDVIAQCLGLKPSTIYNQMNMDEKTDLVGRFLDWCNLTANDLTISWVCNELGGFFVKNVKAKPSVSSTPKVLSDMLKEFSELIQSIADSVEDGVITRSEVENSRKEWSEFQQLTEGYIFGLETSDIIVEE